MNIKNNTTENDQETTTLYEHIRDTGSVITQCGKHKIHCLTIIGEIEGHSVLPPQSKTTKYEHIIPQLVSIEQDSEIDGLLIILNTDIQSAFLWRLPQSVRLLSVRPL